jgi:hypothetical protein
MKHDRDARMPIEPIVADPETEKALAIEPVDETAFTSIRVTPQHYEVTGAARRRLKRRCTSRL